MNEVAPAARRSLVRRPVLWAAGGVAVALAVLIAVMASAEPSSEVSANSPLLGNLAPAISGPGLDGGHYSLSQYRGEWVLVNFMASWCVACQKEMPQLQRFWQEHKGDAVVLSVAEDPSDVGHLTAYLRARGAHWPAVDDPAAAVAYGLQGMPTSFLVAPDGVVYWYLLGEVQARQLDALLKQGAAAGLGAA
ncbi:MAG TPA: TlpA disulfide reductase family protein [Acidimicrobiales bacterium]|nr:TlpA disulfide reductase family protein [Acidimicrobiales bacterium]